MKTAITYVDISLNCCCPHCDVDVDLINGDYNDCDELLGLITTNKWDNLKGEEVQCPECQEMFKIEDVRV